MIKVIVFLFCFFVSVAQAKLFDIQEFYLENGLRVLVVPNHKAPVVKLMLWYKVGSVDEPLGKGGLAHLLEHLMFRGTKKVKDSDFNNIITAHGGSNNAFTSHDFTVYYEFLDISRLEVALALEADRMQNLLISDEAFETERKIVLQERKQRVSNSPFARFNEVLEHTLWQKNPYSRPITGLETEINSLTKEDAIAFYNNYYSPDNAVLILAGDIELDVAKRVVGKHFSKISNKNKNNNLVEFTETPNTSFRITQQAEEIKQARYIKKYIMPNYKNNMQQTFALMLFSNYFGETENSYLARKYVLTNKLIAAQSNYSAFKRGQNNFVISVVPNENLDIEDMVEEALLSALNDFTEEKLEEEKKKILASLVYLQDDPETSASIVGSFAALGFSVEDIENYAQYIKDVKLDDVKDAVSFLQMKSTNVKAWLLPYVIKGDNDA